MENHLASLNFRGSTYDVLKFTCSCLLAALLANHFTLLNSSRQVPALTSRAVLNRRNGKTFPISKLLLIMVYQTMQITWGLSIYDQLL